MHASNTKFRALSFALVAALSAAGCDDGEQADSPADWPLSTQVYVAAPEAFSVTSTLIEGESSAILVDAQFTLSEGAKVAEWIAATGKELQAIYITHGHPDHYFGVGSVLEQFPGTPVYATAAVVEYIHETAAHEVEEWKPVYGDELPDNPVIPQVLEADHLELEGHRIDIVPLAHADTKDTTAVHIPDLGVAIVGDLAYRGMHVWLAETDARTRQEWLASIDQIKALSPKVVVAGHKEPSLDNSPVVLDDTATYIETFEEKLAASANAEALIAAMKQAYPDYVGDLVLEIAAQAAYANR